MDFAPYRKTYGPFPVERQDWLADPEAHEAIVRHGPDAKGAGALVWNQGGHVLLVWHKPGVGWEAAWAPPGGLAELGESPEACLVREVREETGVEVRVTALTKVVVYNVAHRGKPQDLVLPLTFFQFEGDAVGGKLRPGKEIDRVAWFDSLPADLHFRRDYVDAWRRRRPSL